MSDDARGVVAFDARDCAPHVAVVDLDGGPYARDVRVARVWDGRSWRFLDDWTVRDGMLLRPGRAPIPTSEVLDTLELDAMGRVVARTRDGRRVEVRRDADGAFRGMAAPGVEVELTETGARATGGRTVTYADDGGPLDSVQTAAGTTRYQYDGASLRAVVWPDGARLELSAGGTDGLGGRWRCERVQDRTRIQSNDRTWTLEHGDDELTVTDPAGARMLSRWAEGRLTGWTDADGVRVVLERDTDGRIGEVRRGVEAVATLRWSGGALSTLRDALGNSWRLAQEPAGTTGRVDPDGRSITRELTAGRLRVLRRGNEALSVLADGQGRPRRIGIGGQGELQLERDGSGQIVKIVDPVGGTWLVERDPAGRPRAVVAPNTGRWELRFGRSGRLEALHGAGGTRTSIVRGEGGIGQVTVGGRAWSWTRDGAGAVTAIRDPLGATTSLARDPAGRLVGLRQPDGSSLSLGRDALGRLRTIGAWRISRDDAGGAIEVRGPEGALGGWSRDAAGRVSGFGYGGLAFELVRDGAGRVQAARAGEASGAHWRLQRDAAGRVSDVHAADGRAASVLRDGAGLVTRLADGIGAFTLTRDLRGLITRLQTDRTWTVSRDAVGRVIRVEVPGLGTVGADHEPGGALKLVRLADGALVRRNLGEDAGELVAADQDGRPVGEVRWTLDDLGRVIGVGGATLERDPLGRLVRALHPDGEWRLDAGALRGPDGSVIRTDAAGRPTRAELTGPTAWGLREGAVTYRWGEDGALTGLDGPAGAAVLVHDALGRPLQLTLGERAVRLDWDAFGRLRQVGDTVLTGWDGLLQVADAPRVPLGREAVARPGGAVFLDPRGQPVFVPWAGALHPWPTGWLRALDAAEVGPGGRYVLPGGVPVGLLRAYDPLSGAATAPDRWPWTPAEPELGPVTGPFVAVDAATPAFWDPAPFDDEAGWADPLRRLVEAGLLPGGQPEPEEAPGLPWLPASFARDVPAPVAGLAGLLLDEDPVGALVLHAAATGGALVDADILRALIGPELTVEADNVPGIRLPGPGFLDETLADRGFGH